MSGLPFPPARDLPVPGIEPVSLTSPLLAGRFFTTSTTWVYSGVYINLIFVPESLGAVTPVAINSEYLELGLQKRLLH